MAEGEAPFGMFSNNGLAKTIDIDSRAHAFTCDWPDEHLLERFIENRDDRAFATLVVRHGPMVDGVCRRILQDGHAAEDAMQAVFLVLARRAQAIQRPELLANWLYGVACRVARDARRRSAAWQSRAPLDVDVADQIRVSDAEVREFWTLVDDAIQSLPTKERTAFVLCCLHGSTHRDAADRMRAPVGSVATWVTRAKSRLRHHLSRRGLRESLASDAATTALLGAGAGFVALLAGSIARAAVPYASGVTSGIDAPANSIALADGIVASLELAKWRKRITAVIGFVALVLGAIWLWSLPRKACGESMPASTPPIVMRSGE